MQDQSGEMRIPGVVSASPQEWPMAIWSGPGGVVEGHPVIPGDDLHQQVLFTDSQGRQ